MKDVTAAVTYKEFISEKYFRLGLKVGWDEFTSGQFIMVEIPSKEVFLRRPFGIVKVGNGVLEVCVKIVGKGTRALSQIQAGQSVQVLGPLGRGFTVPKDTQTALLIAGGYGIAPLVSLAQMLKDKSKEVIFYYGAKKTSDFLYLDTIKTIADDVRITTEDGSFGEKGIVTDLLKDVIVRYASQSPPPRPSPSRGEGKGGGGPRNDRVESHSAFFSCGPEGLLREVARIAALAKIPAQVSLERYMACGIGVCLGCVVKAKDGSYMRACREGPVFEANNIVWE